MEVLAIILARAGSVGLKNKHLQLLCGKSVIEYTLDHAMAARSITRIVVSTDCPGVTRFARARGLQVIARPPALATADASVQDAMLHAMDVLESKTPDPFKSDDPKITKTGAVFSSDREQQTGTRDELKVARAFNSIDADFSADALVVLYGNVPVRGGDAIDRAVDLLQSTGCDSVRSFCPVGKWHPAWMSKLDGDVVQPLVANSIHRRQDLEPVYLHDGAVVAVSRESMLRGKANPADPHAFFGVDRRGIRTEPGETLEIDHLRDLYQAEAILRDRQTESRAA
jgi:N-acylneuraminate cytidylyltransferase